MAVSDTKLHTNFGPCLPDASLVLWHLFKTRPYWCLNDILKSNLVSLLRAGVRSTPIAIWIPFQAPPKRFLLIYDAIASLNKPTLILRFSIQGLARWQPENLF